MEIIFYTLASLLIISAIMVISVRNPVHSVLFLILCFFVTGGLLILIGAEYIAMTLIIVYVGAVAVLFLFVVMMLDINYVKLRQGFLKYMPFCVGLAAILLIDLYVLFNKSLRVPTNLALRAQPAENFDNLTNTEAIGMVLYTDYMVPFQLAGIILLTAMVGAITLTLRKRPGAKKQDIRMQLNRKRHESVEIVKVEKGQGV